MISDYFNLIISIIEGKSRYIYVNERSIIENYMRLILQKSIESDHITRNCFQELQENRYGFTISNKDFSLIKSEYVTCCSYIQFMEEKSFLKFFHLQLKNVLKTKISII